VLEGPASAVNALFEKISRDLRHEQCVVLADESISQRQYKDWGMTQAKLADWSLLSTPDWIGPSPQLAEAAAAAPSQEAGATGALSNTAGGDAKAADGVSRGAQGAAALLGDAASTPTDAHIRRGVAESIGGAAGKLEACAPAVAPLSADGSADAPRAARLVSTSPSILRRWMGSSAAHSHETVHSMLGAPQTLPTASLEVGPSGPVVRWGALDKVPVRTKEKLYSKAMCAA